MDYPPIELHDSVPDSIRDVVRKCVEPILHDVRVMLTQPPPTGGPAFNLSAALVLASVIAGLGRVFYSSTHGVGATFRTVAKRYPLSDEPANAVRVPEQFADALYKTYRCNLAHSLGLTVDDSSGSWQIVALATTPKVGRDHRGLTEQQLLELERPTGRPSWLPPTLLVENGRQLLSPDALYWGVRRQVRTLAHDTSLHSQCTAFLKPWHDSLRDSDTSMSGTTMTVHTTRPPEQIASTIGPAYAEPVWRDRE